MPGAPQGMIFATPAGAWQVQILPAGFQRPAPPGGGGSPGRSPSPGGGTPSPSPGTPRGGGTNPGTGTGGGGRPGMGSTNPGNPGGNTGRGGGGNIPSMPRNPIYDPLNNRSRILIPKFPDSAATNQQLLYMLARGTGGFLIAHTNDPLTRMENNGNELNAHYLTHATPPEFGESPLPPLPLERD